MPPMTPVPKCQPGASAMLTPRTIRIWSAVHKWTSLICMAFMLLLCVTGLPLLFHHEIDHLLGQGFEVPESSAGKPQAPLDGMLATVKEKWPDEYTQFVGWPPGHEGIMYAVLATAPDAPFSAPRRPVALDARTGEILAKPEQFETFTSVMLQLHVDMYAGLPGKLFLGAMGILLVVSIVSGVVLYAPFMRRLDFGAVRRDRSNRTKWLDLHNLLGIVTAGWLIVVGGTGVINTWLELTLNLWKNDQLAEMTASHRGDPAGENLASFDAVIASAQKAAPDMIPALVAFPRSGISTDRHFVVFMRGDKPLTSRMLKPALIDGVTAELTDVREPPWYLTALLLSQPLHFGDYGGLPLRILWAVLDVISIFVLGSGLYLWLVKKPFASAKREQNGAGGAPAMSEEISA